MRKALLIGGIAAVAIPLYDEVAFYVNETSSSVTLPFIWNSQVVASIGQYVAESSLAILGAILILLAVFLPF